MKALNLDELFNNLAKDGESDIEVSTVFEGVMDLIIAELKPGRILNPHYHSEGSEYYQVLSGEAKMKLGTHSDNEIKWSHLYDLREGDLIEVKENIVHVLENTSNKIARLIFIAPKKHMGEDRFFI
jgi:oxalate decarboxylase/phosphoglucose isomerase-like protein (cupin superfamily)